MPARTAVKPAVLLLLLVLVCCTAFARGGSVKCTTEILSTSVAHRSGSATVTEWSSGADKGWLVDQPMVAAGKQNWDSQLLFDITHDVAVDDLLVFSFLVRAVNVSGSPAVAAHAVNPQRLVFVFLTKDLS
jgi:hypothetical protein